VAVAALLAAAACAPTSAGAHAGAGERPRDESTAPEETAARREGTVKTPTCRLVVTPHGADAWALALELVNPTDAGPVAVDTMDPFLDFELQAEADGAPLAVDQPGLDIPVRPRRLTLDPGQTVTLHAPVLLRARRGAPPPEDGFTWTIDHEPAGVTLTVRPGLAPPFDRPCSARLSP
jgi:hypothetical protein